MKPSMWSLIAGALIWGTALTASAQAQAGDGRVPVTAARCAALGGGTAGGLTVRDARFVAAGPLSTGQAGSNGAAPPPVAAPGHCLIEGAIEPRTGADGEHYAINVQLRVPADWNGRLMYQGGGGLNGTVGVAYGANTSLGATAPSALSRGFAVVTTDSGHTGSQVGKADFARDQEAKLNYAYKAIGKVTTAAKATLERLAGAVPDRSYYVGCSTGGREALIAAQRYPLMFDGVAAGNPAFDLSRAALLAHYSTRQYRAANVTEADLRMVGQAAVRQCDPLDGRKDGMIFDRGRCAFSPRTLQCASGNSAQCLTKEKVDAIERAFRGPVDGDGRPLFAPWTYDAGVGDPGWMVWQTGELAGLSDEIISRYYSFPPLTPGELERLDYVRAYDRMEATAAITDATSTDFSTFRARGGKVLIATGLSDPIFAPDDLVRWYEKLDADTRAAGGGAGAADFARLFLVPGMMHCGGGPGLDDFDALGALVDWVEKGRAPSSMVARGAAVPGESRPICAYPAHAVFRAGGGRDAGDYECRRP